MTNTLQHLAKPLTVRGVTLKNRVVVPPMSDAGVSGDAGAVQERHIQRYAAYALGGAGLIIVEACAVTRMEEPRHTIGLYSDGCIPGLTRLAAAATGQGAVALVQMINTGLSIMPEREIAQISRRQFLQYRDDFVRAALRCKQAGFHGVELHAAHGFYLNQIVETSTRQDEYGGCFQNRVRIIRELIERIKADCGADFLVSVRFGTRNLQELVALAREIESAGGDLLDVSTGRGNYQNIPVSFLFDPRIYAAALVKRAVQIPVICVGNITSGEQAEAILKAGIADLTAVGRGHLCDPAWAGKVLSGERPVPCRRCQTCMWYIDGQKCPVYGKTITGE